MVSWYPQDEKELNEVLGEYLSQEVGIGGEVHGVIVPHAGYEYSGVVAGKCFGLLKNKKINKVIILAPSHNAGFYGEATADELETPLGKVNILKNDFVIKNDIVKQEHSLDVQLPFIQKINSQSEVLPLVVGELSNKDAKEIAEALLEYYHDSIFVVSTDLSHFLPYEQAVKIDKQTIKIIEDLDFSRWGEIDACGKFPLLIMMYLCKKMGWKPKLAEYKNSGDVFGDRSSVVGYAGFVF